MDVQSSIDQLQGGKVCSALDIKAGFFNIPLAEALADFLGLVTQDALYQFLVMCFGHKLAPGWFQMVMNIALSRAQHKLQHGTYLDDATVTNSTTTSTWRDTLEAIRALVAVGLPINIWKC